MPKVHVVGIDTAITRMFIDHGWSIAISPSDADLIQFTGGSDVDPSLYGEEKHSTTWSNPKRDAFESHIYHSNKSTPMAGICRGGQFLNVMNGGKMWQNVNNHMGSHKMTTHGGQTFLGTSDHHQMMRPTEAAQALLTANVSTRKETASSSIEGFSIPDIEAVYYPGALCFQPHPEYSYAHPDETAFYFALIKQFFNLG